MMIRLIARLWDIVVPAWVPFGVCGACGRVCHDSRLSAKLGDCDRSDAWRCRRCAGREPRPPALRLGARLNRLWQQWWCSHEVTLSDYLVTIDDRGIQHRVDYCAICGQVSPSQHERARGD